MGWGGMDGEGRRGVGRGRRLAKKGAETMWRGDGRRNIHRRLVLLLYAVQPILSFSCI